MADKRVDSDEHDDSDSGKKSEKSKKTDGPEFVWPVRGLITTYFGEVGWTSPRGHAGLDISAPSGTPIKAAKGGEVLAAGWTSGGYGIQVIIKHSRGFRTLYAHLSGVNVEPGERVKRGDVIGYVGSTGFSTGAHLHFEVSENGVLRNPLNYLP